MAVGLAATLTGCGQSRSGQSAAARSTAPRSTGAAPTAEPTSPPISAVGAPVGVGPLGPIPAPHPGPSTTIREGLPGTNRICLTVDDGFNADCVKGYVEFVQRTGIHLTFSPNGMYDREWAPHADVLRPLIERQQVQIINHTFDHKDLRKLSDAQIASDLERNDEWVNRVFGITTRPYYRPPYGFHNPHVDGVAAGLGYTRSVLWNGSYSDSSLITPQFLMDQARKYLKPGVIMLGHANHPTVLGLFDQITDLIRQRDLTPVTLDEMFGTSRATG